MEIKSIQCCAMEIGMDFFENASLKVRSIYEFKF